MPSNLHTMRDSLTGLNRKQLRREVQNRMRVKTNADIFESNGYSWHTTEAERRQEQQHKQMLEHHLRTSDTFEGRKLTQTERNQLRQHLLERLADAGYLQPVKVDKQQLAKERKKLKPARKAGETNFVKLSQRVIRERNLEREIENKGRIDAKTSREVKEYGHFVVEIVS